MKKGLLSNISKIHTTELGIERIKKNLDIDVENVVEYCINLIKKEEPLDLLCIFILIKDK